MSYTLPMTMCIYTLYSFIKKDTRNLLKMWGVALLLTLLSYLNSLDASLTDKERDVMFRQCQWYCTESLKKMNEAEKHLEGLHPKNIDVMIACKSAINGAVTSFLAPGIKAKCLVVAVTLLSEYAQMGFGICMHAWELMREAQVYAAKYDELQNCLLMDMTEKEYQKYLDSKNKKEFFYCCHCGERFQYEGCCSYHEMYECSQRRCVGFYEDF